jgi:hypothetical protein
MPFLGDLFHGFAIIKKILSAVKTPGSAIKGFIHHVEKAVNFHERNGKTLRKV